MAIERDYANGNGGAEPFVFVDGPRPTEAEHIFDHFFLDFSSEGYDAALVQQVQARREQNGVEGMLIYDRLLAMANEESRRGYPPTPGKQGLVSLIELISSSSFDSIRRTALLYYLLLDLDAYNNTQHAVPFVKATGLPRSLRHTITGYWHLDNGRYRTAVSYLEEPEFVPQILQVLSPLARASSSLRDAEERAHALTSFILLTGVESSDAAIDEEELQEAKVVAACWTQSLRAAWLQCRSLVTVDGSEAQELAMMRCVARIVEYCFMPSPKPLAVQALLALPLTAAEETLLSHVIVNPTPNIQLTPSAHATAIDALLVRHINSGQYIEAVLLDRRVNSSLQLLHLSGDAHAEGGGDNERLRKLRAKRQDLVRATLSVLTRVERMVLELGDDEEVQTAAEDEAIEEDTSHSDGSWERVAIVGDASVRTDAGRSHSVLAGQPLSASSAIRSPHPRDAGADPLLSAIVRSSPARNRMGGLANRATGGESGSPLSRSFAASPSAKRTLSLRKSIESLRGGSGTPTKARQGQEMGDVSISSPLARKKPYQLESQAATRVAQHDRQESAGPSTLSFGALSDLAGTSSIAAAVPPTDDADVSGPMARLARQLEGELQRDGGIVEEILRRSISTSANVSPFRIPSTTLDKHAHSTLTTSSLARPTRRYEARYELGREDGKRGDDDTAMEQAEVEEVPARRRRGGRQPPTSVAARSRARKTATAEHADEDGDTSVPGSFPGQVEESSPVKAPAPAPSSKRRTISSRKTRQSLHVPSAAEEEAVDDVPDMVQTTSSMRKSRSAASGLGRPKASTPLRRSTRLSVEPEPFDGGAPTTPTPRLRSSRSASPSKKPATTPTATATRRRTRRGASQAPTDASGDEDEADGGGGGGVMTRSSSRRKGGGIPGAF